jgi:hypothetical protein
VCENNGDERSGSVKFGILAFQRRWDVQISGFSADKSYISLITHENPPCHSEIELLFTLRLYSELKLDPSSPSPYALVHGHSALLLPNSRPKRIEPLENPPRSPPLLISIPSPIRRETHWVAHFMPQSTPWEIWQG